MFFGRIDFAEGIEGTDLGESFHIGRRHVVDDSGDPVFVDWRAPVSTAFYRASAADPMGVVRRRRFGVDRGRLTAFEDEVLLRRPDAALPGSLTTGDVGVGRGALLAAEIERTRMGPMRDIVSTIQPEQDEIMRSDLGVTICVQGAPGTGKTAVGLHRAAWLLYSFRSRLERTGVLAIGPNRAFLDHIGAVLPSLGEVRVEHATIESLLDHGRVRASDPTAVAVLKGDPRLARVLERAVGNRVERPQEPLVVPRGVRKWRLPASEVSGILDELRRRDVRYAASRGLLPQRLAHHVLLAMERAGEITDDRVQDAVARSAPVRASVTSLWPALDPAGVLHGLFSDPDRLANPADGILDDDEQRRLVWPKPVRSKGAARWTSADMALLDEVGALLRRRPSHGHVVLDEAQDLSPMQLRAVERRAAASRDRVHGGAGLGIRHGRLDRAHPERGHDDDHQVELVPAAVAKGSEFDRTVVTEPAAIAAAEPDERTGLRRFYVVLTRAVSETKIAHSRPLPAELGPSPTAD